jgi:hypothetical protein
VGDALGSVDASAVGAWTLTHAASAAGQAGAAFLGVLVGLFVVALIAFVISVVALVFILRRRTWPPGHAKWVWALLVPVGFVLAILIPGFSIWVSLVVPIAFWVLVGRIPDSALERDGNSEGPLNT